MKLQGMNDDPISQPPPKSKFNQRRDDPPSRRLSVKIRRHYGAVDVEFGVETDANPENQADQERLFSMLELQVSDMHDLYAKDRLPKVPALQPEKAQGDAVSVIDASWIVKNGRGQWRVLTVDGTKYSKYGAILNTADLPNSLVLRLDDAVKAGNDRLAIHNYRVQISGGIVRQFIEKG